MELDTVHCMDALDLLRSLDAQSVDAIITDLPYGTTAASWDVIIPFAPLWEAVRHALKPRGVFVTTASQPFTSMLVMSNLKWFRYEWIWDKGRGVNFVHANEQPMKSHENVVVFSENVAMYMPQMWVSTPYITNGGKRKQPIEGLGKTSSAAITRPTTSKEDGKRFPISILTFKKLADTVHPTQKPVALFEYLILTYTQPNALVVDPCCGSGTTGVAARNTNRRYILGDTSEEYVAIARKRLAMPFTVPMFE